MAGFNIVSYTLANRKLDREKATEGDPIQSVVDDGDGARRERYYI